MTPEQYLNTPNDVIARHFANWQKQQMIKDAIDAKIGFRFHRLSIDLKDNNIDGFDCGDKVKLIIIKDNEQRIY